MKNNAAIALFFLCALALGGCQPSFTPEPNVGHVRIETVSHVIAFNDGMTALSPTERGSLEGFASTLSPAAVSYVAVATDDMGPRAMARARAIRNYLAAQGFDKKLFRLTPEPYLNDRSVMLTVQYSKAVPPQHCPNWSAGAQGNSETTDSPDFGCSYNTDFLIQIADPADYNGRHSTPNYDAPRDSVAINRYLTGVPQPASGGSSSGSSSGSSGSSGGSSTTTSSSP